MKDKINEAFDQIDEKYITKTENPPKKSRFPKIALTAAAIAVLIAVTVFIGSLMSRTGKIQDEVTDNGGSETVNDETTRTNESDMTETEKPEDEKPADQVVFNSEKGNYSGAKYSYVADLKTAPVNCAYKGDRWTEYRGKGKELSGFYNRLYKLLLDGEKNGVVSPLNIYTSLALLAECTDGQSRAEILKALGANSIEQLRDTAKLLWEYNNINDIFGVSAQANSIWLAKGLPVKQNCVDILNNEHYASAFSGDFADENYVNSLKQWLSDQTGGLLDKNIKNVDIVPETTGAILASTLYYKSRWSGEFRETENGKFNGEDCVLNKKTELGNIYKGSGFTAFSEYLSGGNSMWFFLPDEGKTVSDVLDSGLVSYINGDKKGEFCTVTFRMPDFDVSYDGTINEALAKLGINECRTESADFSPLTDDDGIYLGEVRHAVRIKADKEGVEGASVMTEYLSFAPETPPPAYDFTLDRPFAFVVENNGTPLFVGCVNEI